VTAVDPRADLEAEVRRRFGAAARIENLSRLAGGASRELWAFDAIGDAERHELVLRRDPKGVEDPPGRARELAVLRAAHAAGVPVPEPYWLTASGTGLVMQRLVGEAIPRRLLRDERYERARARLVEEVARAAAAVHAIAPDAIPGLDGGAVGDASGEGVSAGVGIGWLEDELDRIGEPHPALELGLRWLRAHEPPPRAPAVVHGDFRLGNFLVGEAGLVAVLDWELAHLGNPAEDLGWLCVRSWRFGSDDRPAAGCGSRDELLEAYVAAGGREVSRDELRFWEAYGNVRWGIICLVQADQHLSGRRRSLEHAAIGRRTCEPEWDLLAMIEAR
jgi:aminoglycoside phosphotransferase (APT) family kinase protein